MAAPKILFLLADGARARFVERSPETGRFVTVREIDGRRELQTLRDELRSSQPARAMEQNQPGGHAVNQQDFFRAAKEAFAAEIAEKAALMARRRACQGVFVAAPARLIAVLRKGLAGKARIAGELNRDLTQAPDAELEKWLPARPMAAAG